jgi:hypothetical protein
VAEMNPMLIEDTTIEIAARKTEGTFKTAINPEKILVDKLEKNYLVLNLVFKFTGVSSSSRTFQH